MQTTATPRTPPSPRAPAARLFLALWPSDAERAALEHDRARWSWPPGCAQVSPEKLHLTLHFLGAVPRQRLHALQAGLHVPFEPFTLHLDQPALWTHGVAVLGMSRVPAALQTLRAQLGEALLALAVPVETRPFRPHVTLARHAAGAVAPPTPPTLSWRVRAYALVESVPGAAGEYRRLQLYPPA
jgi:RNA 2',3'-cyclic 3'-phosphodiesterase